MTSFCMTSLHVDLNEAVKIVDITSLLILHSHTHSKYNMATIFGLTKIDRPIHESSRHENLERTGVQQMVRMLYNNNFINPRL